MAAGILEVEGAPVRMQHGEQCCVSALNALRGYMVSLYALLWQVLPP